MEDITAAVRFFVAVELLGLVTWPLISRIFRRFPDEGWAFSKIFGILSVTWCAWMLSSLHILAFRRGNTLLLTLALAAACWGWRALHGKNELRNFSARLWTSFFGPDRNWFIITGEIVFAASFFFWTDARSFKPDLQDLEKFMDYGFMLSSLKTEYFPPLDHFLARETINYYYLGHTIAALLVQLSGVVPGMGYNLQMSNLLALGLIESFSLGAGLFWLLPGIARMSLRARSMASGLVSATFVMLLGNLHYAVHLPFVGGSYWYPDATRYIPATIHEFPFYSFIVNDLHGHVSDIPLVLLSIALTFSLFFAITAKKPPAERTEKLTLYVLTAFSIGACYVVSSWEFAIYLVLYGLSLWTAHAINLKEGTGASLRRSFFTLATLVRTALGSVLVVGVAILFWLPHWFTMKPPAQGIGLVTWGMHSPPAKLALVWGLQGFFVIGYLLYRHLDRKRQALLLHSSRHPEKPKKRSVAENDNSSPFSFPEILITLSALLILIPELIYFKDIYPGHPRANTVFKFYYQAWIMLGIVAGCSIALLWTDLRKLKSTWSFGFRALTVVLIAAGGLYSCRAVNQTIGGVKTRIGIDGTRFLDSAVPADSKAIQWMNANIPGQPLIVEAVGESYTLYSRVASFTAFPTILGWPAHEWLWRGSSSLPLRPTSRLQKKTGQPDTVDIRREDVRVLYETENVEIARQLLQKYGVAYIYLGALERDKYPGLKEDKFSALAQVIYDRDGVKIYKVQE